MFSLRSAHVDFMHAHAHAEKLHVVHAHVNGVVQCRLTAAIANSDPRPRRNAIIMLVTSSARARTQTLFTTTTCSPLEDYYGTPHSLTDEGDPLSIVSEHRLEAPTVLYRNLLALWQLDVYTW